MFFRPQISKKLARLAPGFLIFLLAFSGPARAAEVFVIAGKNLAAFAEVIQGFTETVGKIPFQTLNLNEDGNLEETQSQALRQSKSAVALAVGSQAAALIKNGYPGIPMIFCMVFDSHQYRGENITGIGLNVPALAQFQALKSVLPSARRIGVVFDPGQSLALVEDGRQAAAALDLVLAEKTVTSSFEISNAVKEMIWNIDTLWVIPDRTVVSKESFRYMLEASINRKVPILAFSEAFVKGGALLAVAPDYPGIGRQAAGLAKKILGGASPGGIPPLLPPGQIVLNLNTAKALSISIPPEVLKGVGKIY